MIEAQECGGRGGGEVVEWGVGEAAISRAVGEHGGRGGEAINFNAHEREGGPAGEGPGAVAVSERLARGICERRTGRRTFRRSRLGWLPCVEILQTALETWRLRR